MSKEREQLLLGASLIEVEMKDGDIISAYQTKDEKIWIKGKYSIIEITSEVKNIKTTPNE